MMRLIEEVWHIRSVKRRQVGVVGIHERDFLFRKVREFQADASTLPEHGHRLIKVTQNSKEGSVLRPETKFLCIRSDQKVVGTSSP